MLEDAVVKPVLAVELVDQFFPLLSGLYFPSVVFLLKSTATRIACFDRLELGLKD